MGKIRKNLEINSSFEGSSPDIEAANQHLREKRLLGDIQMTSLVNQRQAGNPLTSRTVILNLSEESKKNSKVISDLKIPIYADLENEIEQFRNETYEFTLTITVKF